MSGDDSAAHNEAHVISLNPKPEMPPHRTRSARISVLQLCLKRKTAPLETPAELQ